MSQSIVNSHKDWRLLAERVQGTSHISDDIPCQDFFCVEVIDSYKTNYQPVLLIFVADGAGSATFGGEGAQIACESALTFIKDAIETSSYSTDIFAEKWFDEVWGTELINHVQSSIQNNIENQNESSTSTHIAAETSANAGTADSSKAVNLRDYACTFLGVIVTNKNTLLLQVGDGAIVLSDADIDELHCPIKPSDAEYANMTHFITDANALSKAQTQLLTTMPKQIAVMTDGLQRLALTMADFQPHPPFFKPFFATLQRPQVVQAELQQALFSFLDSDAVNQRTDDDKTLVLAQYLKK